MASLWIIICHATYIAGHSARIIFKSFRKLNVNLTSFTALITRAATLLPPLKTSTQAHEAVGYHGTICNTFQIWCDKNIVIQFKLFEINIWSNLFKICKQEKKYEKRKGLLFMGRICKKKCEFQRLAGSLDLISLDWEQTKRSRSVFYRNLHQYKQTPQRLKPGI